MEILEVKIGDLKPYKANAKKHPKKQIDLLKQNIERFGFTTPVLIDNAYNIIAGHGRLMAMQELGKETVPCVQMGTLTEEEVKALRLADNRIAEMGEWDMDLVIAELKDISAPLLDLTGFSKDLIITPEEADDEAPALPDEPQSKLGDLYELGSHRVLCGDSMKMEDVERLVNGKQVEMVFTDPPYGIDLLKDGKSLGKSKKYNAVKGDDREYDPSHLFQWCKDVFTWGANHYADKLPASPCWIVWDKQGGAKHNSFADCEIAWCSKRMPARCITHIWDGFRRDSERGEERAHPTQKPIHLLVQCFMQVKAPNLLLDLFLGSGSKLIAAQKTNRICYGMELDPKYVDVIVSRYCKYVGSNTIRKNGALIDWKSNS